jgi:hypothetical protein
MYPPKVTDQAISSLIRELSSNTELPSGAAVREVLQLRYGSRGGVARVYRLLANERSRLGSTALSSIESRLQEQENRSLREQLQALRQREDAQQLYWARQVAQLRERVASLETLVQQAASTGPITAELRHDIDQTATRSDQLGVMIRAFGPASHRGGSGG